MWGGMRVEFQKLVLGHKLNACIGRITSTASRQEIRCWVISSCWVLQEHPVGLSVLFRGLFWGEFTGD